MSPLLKASSSLSVAWKLYRATDSISLSLSPSSWAESRAGSFLLPLQSRTVFLCFENVFVLLMLGLKLPPTGEKQEAEICYRAGRVWELAWPHLRPQRSSMALGESLGSPEAGGGGGGREISFLVPEL